jgi:integrase
MASIRKRSWTTSKGEPRSAWVVDFVDAAGNRDRRQFDTKREADAFRVEVEGQLRAGTYRPDARKVTVKEAAEAFVEHCRGRMERGERMTRTTFETYRGYISNHVLHPEHGIGGLKLAQLTSGQVGRFRDSLRSAGVSVPTTRKILSTLQGVLEHAKSRDLLAVNAAKGTRVIGRRDEDSKKITPPSKAELQALLAVAPPPLRRRILFSAATGVRASELYALRWHHIDFTAGEVRIETRVDRHRQEDTTKTEAGVRTIPLASPILAMLKAWRLGSGYSRDSDLIFPNSRGRYSSHSNIGTKEFRPARKAAGLPDLNWHALRHFAVSCWIEQGLSPKTVQTFAGHKSLEVTMSRYGHLFPSEDHRVAMEAIAVELFR